ncbi:MAG TPA: sigma factor-like helix-turn-helix DNA-binding protein, partial [Isosphaeraceae bacterium]|nr:sigma factor-like helix-turn-helix DNA-binding protein [Isosphaeraceae bacterium]
TGDGFWRNAPSTWKAPEDALLDDEFWSVLEGCLDGLPRSLAHVFMLRELEQIDVEELCKILGLTPGNLRIRLHRARLLLRDCLERRWFGSRSDEAPRTP